METSYIHTFQPATSGQMCEELSIYFAFSILVKQYSVIDPTYTKSRMMYNIIMNVIDGLLLSINEKHFLNNC